MILDITGRRFVLGPGVWSARIMKHSRQAVTTVVVFVVTFRRRAERLTKPLKNLSTAIKYIDR